MQAFVTTLGRLRTCANKRIVTLIRSSFDLQIHSHDRVSVTEWLFTKMHTMLEQPTLKSRCSIDEPFSALEIGPFCKLLQGQFGERVCSKHNCPT